jgi:hypothetical protein
VGCCHVSCANTTSQHVRCYFRFWGEVENICSLGALPVVTRSRLCGGERAAEDHVTDSPVPAQTRVAPPGAALILDGLFLHRQELRDTWDFSIFLDAPFDITIPRAAARGPGWGGSPDPTAPANRRYIEGQRIYLREDEPHAWANAVIDYSDLTAPVVIAWRWPGADNTSQEND